MQNAALAQPARKPRSGARNPVLWQARVVCREQGLTIDCRLRNLSENGAKLEIDGSVPLPATFEVVAPAKGRTWRARSIWRHAGETGVELIRDGEAAAARLDPEERIRRLEAEKEKLLAKLKALQAEFAARVARDEQL